MVDFLQLAAGILGFGPAMTLMFFTLRNYTYPKVEKPFFDDRKLFAFFALGVVLGMVIYAFETWGSLISSSYTILLLILGFALMEELMKLAILNFPRFQRKVDTAFYGLSMGLGIAATYTFASVYVFLTNPDLGGKPQVVDLVVAAMLGLLFVLLHGSTTTLIGIGVARGDVSGYFTEALLIHIGFALLYESFFAGILSSPWNLIGLVGAAAVAFYGYRKIHTLSLPVLIQDAKRLSQKAAQMKKVVV
jgi:hypothetical protein